jgi:hypothetical protein
MEIKFSPSSDKFEGQIVVKALSYEEKLDIVDEMNSIFDDEDLENEAVAAVENEAVADSEKKKKQTQKDRKKIFAQKKILARMSKRQCVLVALKRKEDGVTLDSFEQLSYDSEGHEVIDEIGVKLLNKMQVGKN